MRPAKPTMRHASAPDAHDAVSANDTDCAPAELASLKAELQAAAGAASSQISLIAATAAAEARLSVQTTISSAFLRSLSAAFLLLTLVIVECLLGFWAVGAGVSITVTMLAAAALNLLLAGALHAWHASLDQKIGFSRTSQLLKELTPAAQEETQ